MKFSAVIVVSIFGSVAAGKPITLEKKEFSVNDQKVVVEFNNPEEPLVTNYVGIFSWNTGSLAAYSYPCASVQSSPPGGCDPVCIELPGPTDCENKSATKEGTVVFNFKAERYLLPGRYSVCLNNKSEDSSYEQIGKCQKIKLVGKKKSPIKIEKKISMDEENVQVKFNNPNEPRSTNFLVFYNDLTGIRVWTCGSNDYKVCENEPVKKKGMVKLNVKELSLEKGKYLVCLVNHDDPGSYPSLYENSWDVIGVCQKVTVFDPNCKGIDTLEECQMNGCQWKTDKNKCK